jgi:DNA-binding transcriptional regulator LsrR (DeoR family)
VLSVEDWAEIRRLHKTEGLPIKLIARTLGISRNTVRAAVASVRGTRLVVQSLCDFRLMGRGPL